MPRRQFVLNKCDKRIEGLWGGSGDAKSTDRHGRVQVIASMAGRANHQQDRDQNGFDAGKVHGAFYQSRRRKPMRFRAAVAQRITAAQAAERTTAWRRSGSARRPYQSPRSSRLIVEGSISESRYASRTFWPATANGLAIKCTGFTSERK